MEKVFTPWQKGVLLICQKCHKAIDSKSLTSEVNSAEVLRDYLRKELAQQQAGKGIRVMVSGCLNVCKAQKQAIVYAAVHEAEPGQGTTEAYTIHPEQDREQVLEFLKQK
jgi:predicted metal-binding protein